MSRPKCYTRWSDPVLRKRYSLCWTPTSEDETSSIHRSRSSSPLLSVPRNCLPSKGTSSGCCLCHNQCNRKKSSKSFGTRNVKKLSCLSCQEPQKIRESLELHLTGTQVDEALAEDRQIALIQHLDLTTSALEALAQYVQSLQVSHLAVSRVLNVSYLLTFPYPSSTNYSSINSTHLTTHLQQIELQKENKLILLQDLLEYCSKQIALPKQLQSLMNDHSLKKKDFYVATKNFNSLLHNSKLSIAHMEKLHNQYDTILNSYQQSRHILDVELPKVINMRLMMVQQSLKKIRDFHNEDSNNQTIPLLKLIEEKLYQDDSITARVQMARDQASPHSDLCQKCKTNRIDKK